MSLSRTRSPEAPVRHDTDIRPVDVRPWNPVFEALEALRSGKPVLVVDDQDREDEGDVVLAAALAEPRSVAWTVRHTSGFLCAPMPAARADELDLPPMVTDNADPHRTDYAVSVDAARGVGTGISATDRARTARVLADPATRPADLIRPGHVLPLRARPGGVVDRPGHTEAGVDLCRLAGLPPVALIAELVNDDGTMARRPDVDELGRRAGLPVLDIAALVTHRLYHGDGEHARVTRMAHTRLPTRHGELRAIGYRDDVTGAEHLALLGEPTPGTYPLVAVRHVAARKAFGARLSDLGMVQQMIADNEIDLAATRALLREACQELDEGGHGRKSTSIAKTFAAEALHRVVDRAAQMCGGLGVSTELPIARIAREIRPFRIYDGPSEVHRWSIARRAVRELGGNA
ncbi:3,4-dihydroxy-2-butanone-4-phosphate synthase [Saccharomonospora viridis]|jgi:3,4-dihydroxy 2-butanone 4-phosphate synthase/GTP cyclohydrolase II|uniref:3,4-dihydroxy-2-butanone-4-phosphate synthase n=1 Tax=Saccharomonospora viridis TaxID=1852 RepID=UPI00240A74BE|nr:3,4-dihydroxy-2-butanone-4-phosphate synthase [Saccharomonospora viridis]